MTREEAKKILEAYIACESKKAHFKCSDDNCDDNCPLLYEMGTVGERNEAINMAIQVLEQTQWIPVSERLPETDNENSINNYNVLLWVKNKSHPEREPQIYLGKLRHVNGDDGSGNFWGLKIEPCEWTIWGWFYFNEPEVIAWMPLPTPYLPDTNIGNMSEIPTDSENNRTCHTCKHYTSGEYDGSCGSYICEHYSNWESEDKG